MRLTNYRNNIFIYFIVYISANKKVVFVMYSFPWVFAYGIEFLVLDNRNAR
jgi:hypothetical protein